MTHHIQAVLHSFHLRVGRSPWGMMVFLLAIANFLPGVRHLSAFAPPADSERPNIVVIFIDDLGYGDIGPFGATKQKTPNLDRMASEGMKLSSFDAAPVCSV